MVKKKNGSMTIGDLGRKLDDLASSTNSGFAEVHEKMDKGFAEVHEKFAEVEKRFDKVDYRLVTIDRRLDAMVDDHGPRLNRVEKHLKLAPIH